MLCVASVRVFVIYAYSNHEYLHVKTFFSIEQFDKSCVDCGLKSFDLLLTPFCFHCSTSCSLPLTPRYMDLTRLSELLFPNLVGLCKSVDYGTLFRWARRATMATTGARATVAIRETGTSMANMANMANGAHSASMAAGAVRGRPWSKGPWL